MKNFKLFNVVALTADLPEENLLQGQVGTIVEVYNEGEAFEVEFVNVKGETYGLLTLYPEQLMLLHYEPVKIAA
ncbi:hypothetical protein BH24ACI2_BH24ACI2_01870 [soil metagenome]|jgi:hypothetical protein|nr:DUF4926 domain-containing protein [Acidobacteriota bacterium]